MTSQDIYMSVSHHVCIVIFALVCIGFIDFIWKFCLSLSLVKPLSFLYFTLLASNPDPSSDVVLWPFSALGLPTDSAQGVIHTKT